MTKNGRPTILRIQELVHKQMHRGTKRIDRKVANIFREREQGKGRTE